ncbi:MAG: GNAT superfamily N-acetyltransferase [Desulforhopalus sp.]|jgi:GNAT superfamily N-acetyltransferase
MTETTIELASAVDAETLKNMSIIAFTNDFKEYGAFPPDVQSISWHLTQIEKGHYYKIKYNGELAGGICLILQNESLIKIKCFFIAESFQNKSIGSRVIKLIETHYNNVTTWALVTPYKAYRNHHFYEKLGYVKNGEIQPDPNNAFTIFKYIKRC